MIKILRISLAIVLFGCVSSVAQVSTLQTNGTGAGRPDDTSSLYLKVRLDSPLKLSKLRPGDQISGKLAQDVYRGGVAVFPALSKVRLTVDRLERRRRSPDDHWPWMMKAFTPRHENWPVFRAASVTNPDGSEMLLGVSLISANKEVEIEPKTKKQSGSANAEEARSQKTRLSLGPLLTLTASTQGVEAGMIPLAAESVTIPSGTQAKVILLGDISASKNHAKDSFRARLVEPVFLESKVLLPEGTMFEGTIVKSQAPRSLSRAGSIALSFTNMTVPYGTGAPIVASVAGAQVNERSHTVIDPEGHMHGDRPGKVWMLVNIGSSAGIAKVADDGTQLIIEALVSTATDVSTAGTARIASTCASAIFFLTRHGRDVVLPKYTQMKIVFDRPVMVSNQSPGSAAGN